METVLGGLRQCWPVVGYRVLDSQYFGVAQRRRRLFFVCGPTDGDVAEVLALTESGGRDPAPGGAAGTGIAYALAAGAGGSKFGSGRAAQDTFVTAFDTTQITHRENRSRPLAGEPCHPLAATANPPTIAATLNTGGCEGGFRSEPGEHLVLADPISASEGKTYTHEGTHNFRLHNVVGAVRRLTPIECERLQGFPDGHTCLCGAEADWRACTCPDSARYRALGNAVTVNVVAWLGARLARVMAR